jgi:UTP:GlnB (protein PII) uridylyltransferase
MELDSQLNNPIPAPRAPIPMLVEDFLNTMPLSYQDRFTEADARVHASILSRRHDALVHIESCRAEEVGTHWLCVVTNERPGLLRIVAAAVTAHSLNVAEAITFCRAAGGHRTEAVYFFRVGALSGEVEPPSEALILSLRSTIADVLKGKQDITLLYRRSSPTWRPQPRTQSTARFEGEINGADVLIVEGHDDPGLLASIAAVVFRAGAYVVWSHVTTARGRARDVFHVVAPDGARLSETSKAQLVADLSSSAEPASLTTADVIPAPEPSQVDTDRLSQLSMAEPAPAMPVRRFSKPPR